MKESDLCVVAVVYGVATWFLVMTLQLPPQAQSYPLILLTALYVCNTLLLGKQLYSFFRHRLVQNDFRKIFASFVPGQFFGVIAGCLIYMAVVNYLGYYISSILYLLLAQFFLKVKPIPAVITCAVIMIVTYLVFSLFLHVPLPVGVFFE